MALQPLNGRREPYSFDALDAQVTSCKGGEVCTFTYVSIAGTDKKAADEGDGYVSTSRQLRNVLTTTLVSGNRPLFLVDEGSRYYGTLFGELIGSTLGQVGNGPGTGTQVGPHTAAGSGKWAVWSENGQYSVTLDAVDTTAATGLAPSNTTITGGAALYATTAGLLTPNIASAFEALVVGRFIEFATNQSLVTSPLSLVQSLNSPTGAASVIRPFDRAIFFFNIET